MNVSEEKIEKRFYFYFESYNQNWGDRQKHTMWSGFTFEQFMKWKWYFEYRSALYKVQNPHRHVVNNHGSVDYELPEQAYIKKLRNRVKTARKMLTQFQNKINQAKKGWTEIFPIEEHPMYSKILDKLKSYQTDYDNYKNELSKYENTPV